jgi:hypothetical protein
VQKKFLVFLLGLVLLFHGNGWCQYYTTGNDPSRFHWKTIDVGGFPLIFPDEYLSGAINMAGIMKWVPEKVTASMAARIKGYPVIVHPGASYSNGITILAPRRVELYPKHPLTNEIGEYASQLILHEARHMAQMDRLNTGFTRFAGYLLGEQAQAVVLGLHIPTWFLEGDATLTETLLSEAGRGRTPSFSMPLRTRLISHELPGWDPMALGSYKHYYPSEYLFGYYLTARARMLSYPKLWSDALGSLGRNPFQISGFTLFVKRKTGLDKQDLYLETMRWLSEFWFDNLPVATGPEILKPVSVDTSDYYSYIRPYPEPGNSVVCLKRSLNEIPAFIRINADGTEQVLVRPGSLDDAGFDVTDGLIAWCEHNGDIRWENQTHSDLYVWNEKEGKTSRIRLGRRLFNPSFDPGGNYISCVSESISGGSELLIIDVGKQVEIQRVPVPKGEYVNYQCWGSKPGELFVTTTSYTGRKLMRVDLNNHAFTTLLDGGFREIGNIAFYNGYLYFTAPEGATLELFRLDLSAGTVESVASHINGISHLMMGHGKLGMSVHFADGFRPYVTEIDQLNPIPHQGGFLAQEPVTAVIARAEGEEEVKVPVAVEEKFQPESYKKAGHLFNIHSWAPVFVDPDAYRITPGVSLMSQNDLSTMVTTAGYLYDKSQKMHGLTASVRYSGFYPILDAEYFRGYVVFSGDSLISEHRGLAFSKQNARLRITLPFNFSSGIWSRRLSVSAYLVSKLHASQDTLDIPVAMTGISTAFGIYRKMSYRDLFPRLGFVVNGNVMHSPVLSQDGWNSNVRAILYLPGGLPNSSLRILGSASNYDVSSFIDSPFADIPRGRTLKGQIGGLGLKTDYSFPIAYPDWSLSWLLFVKRVKANLFLDCYRYHQTHEWDFSAGIDLTADFHLLRMGLALEGGIRAMYFPLVKKFGAEFLYSFSIQ